ncbi:hypothetical protein T439DRAFT_377225 [Meredithblackwellia eburnea MCA 4105]
MMDIYWPLKLAVVSPDSGECQTQTRFLPLSSLPSRCPEFCCQVARFFLLALGELLVASRPQALLSLSLLPFVWYIAWFDTKLILYKLVMRSILTLLSVTALAGLSLANPAPAQGIDPAKCPYLKSENGVLICTSSPPGLPATDATVVDSTPIAPLVKRGTVDYSKCLYLKDVDGVLTCTSSPPGQDATDAQPIDTQAPISQDEIPSSSSKKEKRTNHSSRSVGKRASFEKKLKADRKRGKRLAKKH